MILQFYGLFFALGCSCAVCRTCGCLVLAGVTADRRVVVVLPGARPRYGGWAGWETVTDPRPLLIDLLVSGSYPALPTFAFFLVGMWVGRQALGRRQVQLLLIGVGFALALVGFVGGEIITRATTDRQEPRARAVAVDDGASARIQDRVERRGESRRDAVRIVVREGTSGGHRPLARLADPVGHGKMPAWVIGATGWSLAVLGLCLPRLRPLAAPAPPRRLRRSAGVDVLRAPGAGPALVVHGGVVEAVLVHGPTRRLLPVLRSLRCACNDLAAVPCAVARSRLCCGWPATASALAGSALRQGWPVASRGPPP